METSQGKPGALRDDRTERPLWKERQRIDYSRVGRGSKSPGRRQVGVQDEEQSAMQVKDSGQYPILPFRQESSGIQISTRAKLVWMDKCQGIYSAERWKMRMQSEKHRSPRASPERSLPDKGAERDRGASTCRNVSYLKTAEQSLIFVGEKELVIRQDLNRGKMHYANLGAKTVMYLRKIVSRGRRLLNAENEEKTETLKVRDVPFPG